MTGKERERYREQLISLGRSLCQDRAHLKKEAFQSAGAESSGSFSDAPLHPADLGTHHSETEMSLALVENEEQIIEEINRALGRLEDGTFGTCETCQKPIARNRLKVLPHARFCIRCARKMQGETKV